MFVVGIGPGDPRHRTVYAVEALVKSSVIAGYGPYVDAVADLTEGKELIVTGMKGEVERCRRALSRSVRGDIVSLISSGDSGVYGMAGLAIEIAANDAIDVDIEIVPGMTTALAAAAELGAPLANDFAVVSLSDLLTPREVVMKRIAAAGQADLVVAIYNPMSSRRRSQFPEAIRILRQYRDPETPCGIVTAAGTKDSVRVFTRLHDIERHDITMRSIVVVGDSRTETLAGRMVARRGYRL
ncbi:MAG: precorrin-3B C(17)-methyltransferase [Planctomycetota bacterium]|nr:precorrin-3B C(17)-methyltransferase [Planctomycetota bacterium]